MKVTHVIAAAAIGALLVSERAHGAYSIETFIQNHNLFVGGNATLNKEVENRIVVGGTLTIPSTIQMGFNNSPPIPLSEFAVSVYGGVSAPNGSHINQGSALSRLSTTAHFNMNSGGTFQKGQASWDAYEDNVLGRDIPTLVGELRSVSSFMAGKTADGTFLNTDPNNYQILGAGAQVSVVHVNGSQLSNAHGLTINPNGSEVLIINVHGNTNLHANFLGVTLSNANKIVWNYIDATLLSSVNRLPGQTFAMYANVDMQKGTEGHIFVGGNFSNNDELHSRPMTATGVDLITPVPEPSAALMIAVGIFASAIRRRRKACTCP